MAQSPTPSCLIRYRSRMGDELPDTVEIDGVTYTRGTGPHAGKYSAGRGWVEIRDGKVIGSTWSRTEWYIKALIIGIVVALLFAAKPLLDLLNGLD